MMLSVSVGKEVEYKALLHTLAQAAEKIGYKSITREVTGTKYSAGDIPSEATYCTTVELKGKLWKGKVLPQLMITLYPELAHGHC
ncbi:MAG: hypothetical protein HY514_03655 [Candidatus Aenigmarchaeota archaeon]|nr:hypothetical protein [Candidatus Aenigmarchaeota archaeon]